MDIAKPLKQIELVEVSPRDGLQNEPELVSTADKLTLIARAKAAGFRRIEVSSFVNPKRVPQMADAVEIHAGLPSDDGIAYVALALNRRGYERAVEAGAREVNFVLVASDTFAIRNNGMPSWDIVKAWEEVSSLAARDGVRATIVIGASFGCPFEGEVAVERVVALAKAAAAFGPAEIALADTIGVAVPSDVTERFSAVGDACPGIPLRAHFHNTRNTALANAVAAVEAGVGILDSSLAGIGGCPFAPGAAGNVPSEDLVYMFDRMKLYTGIDLEQAIETARWIGGVLGKQTAGMVSRAGGFPKASGGIA